MLKSILKNRLSTVYRKCSNLKFALEALAYSTAIKLKSILRNRLPTVYRECANLKFVLDALAYSAAIKRLYRSYNTLGSTSTSAGSKHTRVVLNLVWCEYLDGLFLASILALKLRDMGCEVYILIDDGILRHYDTVPIGSVYSRKDEVFRAKFVLSLLKELPMYLVYSSLVSKKETETIGMVADDMIARSNYLFKGVDLRPFVESTLVRFFGSAPLVIENEPLYYRYLKMFTENAAISALTASRAKEKLTPDILVTQHGIYTTWGSFYELFKRDGIRSITYDLDGYHDNAVLFSKTGLVNDRNDDGFFDCLKTRQLPNVGKYRTHVEKIFEKRRMNLSPDQTLFGIRPDSTDDLSFVEDSHVNKRKKVYSMFPNVMWDGSITGADSIFGSPLEWVLETINYFEGQSDKLLVIRSHPSESTLMKTRKTLREMIEEVTRRKIGSFKNVLFIDSSSKLSSYKLFPLIDAGLVYNGTLGLELMYAEIPVLIAGRAPYSGKGFTFDLRDKSEYFRHFDKLAEISELQKRNRNLLLLFAYQYFELNGIPLPFLRLDKKHAPRIAISALLGDKNLNHIALTILDQKTYFQEWADA